MYVEPSFSLTLALSLPGLPPSFALAVLFFFWFLHS